MRYLRLFFLLVLALVLISLAMANRSLVTVSALPADFAALLGGNWALELPMFLVIFAAIAVGLLIGFVWEWLREHKHRATAAKSTKAVTKLERELAAMRDAHALPKDDVLALLDKSKA
ncbi:MAG: LapA family protein [Cypionkella sp.]|nr:LapA family protein [Cypionkella sp.]